MELLNLEALLLENAHVIIILIVKWLVEDQSFCSWSDCKICQPEATSRL